MSEAVQEIEQAKEGFIQSNEKKILAGGGVTLVLALAALIIAIIALTYYMDIEGQVANTVVNTNTLLENTERSEDRAELEAQADLIRNGVSGSNSLNVLDEKELEGEIDAAASNSIMVGVNEAERMSVGGRYYTELDDVLRGM